MHAALDTVDMSADAISAELAWETQHVWLLRHGIIHAIEFICHTNH